MPRTKIDIAINKTIISVPEETILLGVIQETGAQIPIMCHDKDFTPTGVCRRVCPTGTVDGEKKKYDLSQRTLRLLIHFVTKECRFLVSRQLVVVE